MNQVKFKFRSLNPLSLSFLEWEVGQTRDKHDVYLYVCNKWIQLILLN